MSTQRAQRSNVLARAARSSPGVDAGLVSAAAGSDTAEMSRTLNTLHTRGPCADKARAAVGKIMAQASETAKLPPEGRGRDERDPEAAMRLGRTGRTEEVVYRRDERDPEAAMRLLSHPPCPPPVALAAAQHLTGPAFLGLLLGASSCSPDLLRGYATHEFQRIRGSVVSRIRCPSRLSGRLAKDPDSQVRARVAYSGATAPVAALLVLARDEDWDVRLNLASSDRCPPQVMAGMCGDSDDMVRAMLASQRSCPPRVMKRLASDDSARVREHAAQNVSCEPETLDRLCADSELRVAAAAALHKACTEASKQIAVSRHGAAAVDSAMREMRRPDPSGRGGALARVATQRPAANASQI